MLLFVVLIIAAKDMPAWFYILRESNYLGNIVINLRICRHFQVGLSNLPLPQGLVSWSSFSSLNQIEDKYGEHSWLDYL